MLVFGSRSGCDTPHVSGGHGERTVHRQFGQLAGVQSLPVKVGEPFRHRAEGRVKSGVVYPTLREAAGAGALGQDDDPLFEVRPSTSRGAGASLDRIEEELLDYDDEVEEHVMSVPRGDAMETPRVVPKVVQGDHFGGRRRELVAGNLARGEEGVLVSVGFGGGREGFGDAIQKVGKDVCGVAHEQRKSRVEASIQVGLVPDTGAGCVEGPDRACAVWIVGHSFVRWAEKQASSRHFVWQLGLDGARIKVSWVGFYSKVMVYCQTCSIKAAFYP
ncbi:hypothetical protein NDU88_002864 [Pleurodeles waltl]|uniref:Uncharacterized protein n=1 Tax=Pleurodeles waltl TaxID=8319 RepID=A0AAV7M2R2_PLEWA|nr:hypothetical protein NDU88_002864 [Pleurodeles waltl]